MAQKFDKNALFNWLQTGAGKLESSIEKGVATAHKAVSSINQKIESSPRAKQIKDKIVTESGKKLEQLKDVRIAGTRIGDLPFAAQKMAERQIYKVISRVHEANPNLDWGQFMPNPETLPVFEAFQTLGVPYGTPFEEVKKVYRTQMREWHPDKHANDPEKEKIATQKTQEITAAYEIISKHYGMI